MAASSLAIEGVDVEQVTTLASGVPLRFTVFGTPGSLAALRIEGARRPLELRETDPGVYEGTYVIDAGDSIRPESRVTASLQRAGDVAYSTLDEPLLLAAGSVPWRTAAPAATPVPIIDAPPSAPPVVVVESRVATPVPVVVARGRSPSDAAEIAAAPAPRDVVPCGDCAVVESVQAVEAAPRGGVIGAIGGAIAGAILGKELGEAHKQRMLTLLGAIGGGLAGRQIERQATQSTQYDVDLRLADGTLLRRRYEQAPPFAAGATIRLGTPSRVVPAPRL